MHTTIDLPLIKLLINGQLYILSLSYLSFNENFILYVLHCALKGSGSEKREQTDILTVEW